MHARQKKERRRTDREAEAERKTPFQRKIMHGNKQLQPKSDRDRKVEQGRVEKDCFDSPALENWRLAKLCSLSRAVEGRVRRRRYTPFSESDMHQLSKQGVPDRFIMATSGKKSFESTKIDSVRTSSTTVDGCLAGQRPLCGHQKKKKKLAIAQPDKMEKLGKPLESILFVSWCAPDDLCNIQISQHTSCRGMWEQQSKPSDLGWTGLHPDRGAACLGLDLPSPARILVLDCLFMA